MSPPPPPQEVCWGWRWVVEMGPPAVVAARTLRYSGGRLCLGWVGG